MHRTEMATEAKAATAASALEDEIQYLTSARFVDQLIARSSSLLCTF